MTVQQAIEYIENYTWSTTRLGLGRTRQLLQALGDPQKALRFIHVAGSNGKGSTCAMLDSILRSSGYRTGLYISPYIQDFCERMQVNGQNIPGEDLARITERVRVFADQMDDHPSQFELVTAIAMEYFREQCCDIVVLEVGMGGALDSTNVIDCPEAAVITNIGLEHTEYLGDTLEKIAEAKGGIIKPGGSVICYESVPEVIHTIEKISSEQRAQLHLAREADLLSISHNLNGQFFVWKGQKYFLPLLGAHQLRNAGVVLETIHSLRELGWVIPEAAVADGLRNVKWPARFEILRHNPLFILDGGHNPQCAEALARILEDYLSGQKLCFLLGVLKDKDYRQILSLIAPFADRFICVTPDSPRALPAQELAEVISGMGFSARSCDSIEAGVRLALEGDTPVIAFGSLYLAGHVRTVFPRALKRFQRRYALSLRDAIPEAARAEKSLRICRRVMDLASYQEAQTVFLFKAFRSEADLSALSRQAELDGKTLVYPVCIDRTTMLAVKPGKEWTEDRFGICAPVLADSEVCSPGEIDLVLCPCVAFDSNGHRLGMGAGYYDRFLPQCTRAKKVLIAFEAQCLEEVYTESFDVPMDAIITEERTEEFHV